MYPLISILPFIKENNYNCYQPYLNMFFYTKKISRLFLEKFVWKNWIKSNRTSSIKTKTESDKNLRQFE